MSWLAGRPLCAAGCLAVANFDQLLNTPMRIRIIFINIFMKVLLFFCQKSDIFYWIFLIRGQGGVQRMIKGAFEDHMGVEVWHGNHSNDDSSHQIALATILWLLMMIYR